MGTPLFGGGGYGHWARLHNQAEISSREAFHDSAVTGVDWQETGPAATTRSARRLQKAVVDSGSLQELSR